MRKAVTIKSIAEQLNLSRNTVAKALNGQYVPEKTRELVLSKARELNYKSLNNNNSNSTNKKYRILLISGKPLNNIKFYVTVVRGIENYCYEKEYELIQYTYNSLYNSSDYFKDYIYSTKCDGIIAIECFQKHLINKILNTNIPSLFIDFTTEKINTLNNFDIVMSNNESPIDNIVRKLNKQHNVKKFTFIGDKDHCLSFRERYFGFIKALFENNIPHLKDEDILNNDESFNYYNPDAIKTEILKMKHLPECFVCVNDFVARKTCDALRMINKNIPNKCMVIGFDNVDDSYLFEPKLSTFDIDKEFLGRQAVEGIVSRINNPNCPSRISHIESKYIERESTLKISE